MKRFLLATLCASMLLGAVPVSAADEVNAPPTVIPAVREWEGGIGRYVPTADTAIVYPSGNAALEKKVEIACGYFRELLGLELHTSDDPASAKDGDIVLKLDDTERDTLGADGYLMDAAASGLTIAPSRRGCSTASSRRCSRSRRTASCPSAGRGTTPIIPSAAG